MTIYIPAGEYYLGDPCYAFTYTTWLNLLRENNNLEDGEAKIKGLKIVAFSTIEGDGKYDSCMGDILVDSGLIGLVPQSLADKTVQHMYRVEFKTKTRCEKINGKLIFGKYIIETNIEIENAF